MKRLALAVVCLVGLAWWRGAAAASPDVSIGEAHVLGYAYVPSQWSTAYAVVLNLGEQPLTPELVVTVRKGLRLAQYSRPVYLPAHCQRSIWFRTQLVGGEPPSIELVGQKGTALAAAPLSGAGLSWSRMIVVGLDDQSLLFGADQPLARGGGGQEAGGEAAAANLTQKANGAAAEGDARRLAYASLNINEFPDHWGGLDSTSIVAIGHVDHWSWRPSQVKALIEWIESGGVLVINPGADFEAWRDSPVASLLPVRIFGTKKQNWLSFEKEGTRWEARLNDYVEVLESEVADGEVVYSEGSLPMVVRKRLGMGAIYFFAFPGSALDTWDEGDVFLAQILRAHERIKPLTQTGLLEKGPRMLDEVAGAQVAPPLFVVATLGGFLLIAAVSLLLLNLKGRGDLAWSIIIPAGIVIAIVSYRVGLSFGKKVGLSLNEMAVASTSSGSAVAFRSGLLGVHSLDQLDGELVAADANTLLASSMGTRAEGGQVTRESFETSPVCRLTNLSAPPRSFPYYVVDSILDLGGGVVAELELGENGLSGVLKNDTPYRLRNCLFASNSYPIVFGEGSIGPGQSVKVTLTDGDVKQRGDFTTEEMLGSRSQTRRSVIENLFTPAPERAFVPWARRLFMIGWPEATFISEKLEAPGTNEQPALRSIAALCVEAVVRPAPAGSKALVPKAFCTAMVRPAGTRTFFDLSSKALTGAALQMGLNFYLPDFASNLKVEGADVHIVAQAYGFDLSFCGRDAATGQLTELQNLSDLNGEATILVRDAGRFHDPLRNLLAFEIKATINEKGRRLFGGEMPAPEELWRLKEAAATLRGTAK